MKLSKGQLIQKKYYASNAEEYDSKHCILEEKDEGHNLALKYVSFFINNFKIKSMLDVGSGTGRALLYFNNKKGFKIKGVEPVKELIECSIKKGISRKKIVEGYGEELPFKNKSFDAVCEFGILHHVENPAKIVKEMMRVSRKAIFISDSNHFGIGPLWARVIKLFLSKIGLLNFVVFLFRGKKWKLTKEDGVAYFYNVYDSYNLLSKWADKIIVLPLNQTKRSWFNPIFTSSNILLCAFRKEE